MSIDFKNTMGQLVALGYIPKKVLDIGCNRGAWTEQMQSWFPNAEFTMIDATDYPKNIKVPFIHTVLCDKDGFVDWYDIQGTGDSYFKETTAHYDKVKPVQRACTTLNTLFDKQLLDNEFNFIKMDTQGAEIPIMKGAPKFPEYISYMDSVGYACYDIVELHRHRGILTHLDIIFVKKTSKILENVQNTIHKFGT